LISRTNQGNISSQLTWSPSIEIDLWLNFIVNESSDPVLQVLGPLIEEFECLKILLDLGEPAEAENGN
jgi:hypothetical protein